MLGKLIPLLIAIAGLGAGVGAGLALRPTDQSEAAVEDHDAASPCGDVAMAPAPAPAAAAPAPSRPSEFVNLANQFVFPLVEGGDVSALVVLTLTVEVAEGQRDAVHTREPKLRDGFLRVLLDHANAGGFQGAFTSNDTMDTLRRALLEKGREDLGDALYDVLILDINRQDA